MLAAEHQQPAALLTAIKESNDLHRKWTQRKLEQRFAKLRGRRIAVLGLTYKPGTDTLRRSSSIELCRWLAAQGAAVSAHDPNVLPNAADLPKVIAMHATAEQALERAEAVVIGTAWPEYRSISAARLVAAMTTAVVIDAARFAEKNLNQTPVEYIAVGTPSVQTPSRSGRQA
jgi:UDPglucose 6-dehydrogenase